MINSGKSALIEEFFFALPEESNPSEPVLITVSIDLAEFSFTDSELRKFKPLLQRLELALLAEFNLHFPAASVVVELRQIE